MEIVKFKKSKSNLYEIMLDNGLSFKLYDDVIVKYNLLVNKKFDDKFFEDVRNYNDSLDAYYLSIKYLNTKMRSEKELKKYLAKKNISQEHIESTIKRLNSEGYLNHETYIKSYINDAYNFTNNGPLKIKSSLKDLGFKEEEITPYLNLNYSDKIKKIIDKKIKVNTKLSNNNLKLHLTNYLINLGYPKESFISYLETIHFDDSKQLQKDYETLIKKYSKKYNGEKLKYFIKNKLYQKGYSIEKIEEVTHE